MPAVDNQIQEALRLKQEHDKLTKTMEKVKVVWYTRTCSTHIHMYTYNIHVQCIHIYIVCIYVHIEFSPLYSRPMVYLFRSLQKNWKTKLNRSILTKVVFCGAPLSNTPPPTCGVFDSGASQYPNSGKGTLTS